MNASHTRVSIGNHTLTFEQYRAVPTRDERMALRRDFIEHLRNAEDAFQDQTRGMVKQFPKRLTKKGQPDRRYGMRPNPEYAKHTIARDQVVRDLSSRVAPVTSTFQFPYGFEEVFNAWEEAVETPQDQIQRLLSGVDWYYNYSDDHSVYLYGLRRMDSLQAMVRKLGPDAQLAFNRACPWLNEDGSQKATA